MAEWNEQRRALLWEMLAIEKKGDPTDYEVDLMIETCERTQLDPFAGQIYAAWRQGKMGIEATIEGLRCMADRTQLTAGQLGPQWCGPDGEWHDIWTSAGQWPYAARVGILRKDWTEPLWATAYWDESKQTKQSGDLNYMWSQRGVSQLAKCAEAAGLRRAFPDIARIYTADEMPERDGDEPERERSRSEDNGHTNGRAEAEPPAPDSAEPAKSDAKLLRKLMAKLGAVLDLQHPQEAKDSFNLALADIKAAMHETGGDGRIRIGGEADQSLREKVAEVRAHVQLLQRPSDPAEAQVDEEAIAATMVRMFAEAADDDAYRTAERQLDQILAGGGLTPDGDAHDRVREAANAAAERIGEPALQEAL